MMEAEKAARFLFNYPSILLESPDKTFIQKQIIQALKLIIIIVKAYSSLNYATY